MNASNSRPDILQVAPMPMAVEAELERAYRVHRYWEAADKPALLTAVGGALRGLVTTGQVGCPLEVIEALPQLELISSYGVGYDAIDIAACKARGVRVANTPDVLNDAMAELTLGLMIALARRLPQADAYTRAGRWADAPFPLQVELTGAKVGILGLGRIGKEIALRCKAFKMQVVYHGRTEQPYEPYSYYADLIEMAREVQWLVVIAPGAAETVGLVSREVMAALGPEGYLVNVARGALVDEPAMVELLQSGALGGAALDVFADEPHPPEALFAMENVILSPHAGSATHKTRRAMGDLVLRNLAAHFAGEPLISQVV